MICTMMALLLMAADGDGPAEKSGVDEALARRGVLVAPILAPPLLPVVARPFVASPHFAPAELRGSGLGLQVRHMGGELDPVPRILTLEQPAAEGREDVEDPAPAPQLRPAVLGRENFDRWIFGDGMDEAGRLGRLHALLAERIALVAKDRAIDPARSNKLRLAGKGDIKRFLDRVEGRRPDFEEARKKFAEGRRFLGQLEPLSEEFRAGPFGEDSLFAKTLKTIDGERRPGPK